MKTLPPLESLSALLAAADQGSLSAAAEILGVTHGSISRRIATLETWLGAPVFDRHGRGVRLTPAGRRFLTDARRAVEILSESAQPWRQPRGRPTVRLSAVPSVARLWLLPRLKQLERTDLRVEVMTEHRPADLGAREADIAIRYGHGGWEGVEAKPLITETLLPAATPEIADRVGAALETHVLEDMPPLLHDSDISQWRLWLREAGLAYRPRWQDRRFEDYDTVLAAAKAGLGVALLRRPLVEPGRALSGLVRVSDRVSPNPKQHYICLRAGEGRGAVLELADRLVAIQAIDVLPSDGTTP